MGRLPLHKELLLRGDRAVPQPLGIAACEQDLHGGEKGLVENLFLIGDELANAVRHLDRATLQFDNAYGDAVQVKDQVRPALVSATQSHFLGQRKIVVRPPRPFDEMHRLMWLPGSDLDRHAVTQ